MRGVSCERIAIYIASIIVIRKYARKRSCSKNNVTFELQDIRMRSDGLLVLCFDDGVMKTQYNVSYSFTTFKDANWFIKQATQNQNH